ncbi:MAG: hypothetical protein M3209_01950 [Acidobacteriota bacterium]|nr:hypothetical protein [Acidobacteriota bacterium]
MERFGLNETLNLAGDTERGALARRGEANSKADAIYFGSAVSDYQKVAGTEASRKIYRANNWQQPLKIVQGIADIIKSARLDLSASTAAAFRLCAAKLYPYFALLNSRPTKTSRLIGKC